MTTGTAPGASTLSSGRARRSPPLVEPPDSPSRVVATAAGCSGGAAAVTVDRRAFRARLERRPAVTAPLCLDALTARLCEDLGFEAGYLSGGALGYARAVSEALLTLSEVAEATAAITRRSGLPIVVDGGVGFGDPVHTARAIWDIEAAGAAGIEIEDQVAPKRVSHHRGVEHLVPEEEMAAKVRAAAEARRDSDFVIIARTGAVRNESFERAVERARTYLEAGADLAMLFPRTDDEWASAARRIGGPVAVIESLDTRPPEAWSDLGVAFVADPYTGQVVAHDAVRAAYEAQRAGRGSGRPAAELQALYRQLPDAAGLGPLFDLERRTTEPGT